MKKHYSLLLVMLLGLLGFSAAARPVEITVEGTGTVKCGMDGDITTVLQQGLNSFEWEGNYYFIPDEGTVIVSFLNYTYSDTDPTVCQKDPWHNNDYCITANNRYTTPLKYTITIEANEPQAEAMTFNLLSGGAALYTYGRNAELITTFTEGENKVDLLAGKMLAITATDGFELVRVTKSDGSEPSLANNFEGSGLPGNFCAISGWEAETYNIVSQPAAAPVDSYDVTFYITGGDAITITHRDYSGGFPPVVETQTVTNGQTLTFKKEDAWECSAPADYELVRVTNADGVEQQIITFSDPHYFQLNTYDTPSSSYTFELKSTKPAGINFYLEEGEAYLWNFSSWSKVQDLVQGDNIFTDLVTGGSQRYAIVGKGAMNASELSVTDEAGKTIAVSPYDNELDGCYAVINGWDLSPKYTIKVTPAAVEPTYNTIVNVAPGTHVYGTYQNMTDYSWVRIDLNEGANEVKIPTSVYEFLIRFDDDADAEKTTCVSSTGASLQLQTKGWQKYYCFVMTPSAFAASYTVTTAQPAPEGITFNLVSGQASVYLAAVSSKHQMAEFYQDLTIGENILPLRDDSRQYAIVAGENQSLTVTNVADNNSVWVNDAMDMLGYPGEWAAIDSWTVASYNITTEAAATSYDVTFNVAGGESIELKQLVTNPTFHSELYRTVSNGEIVNLPKGDSFYIYAPAGYKLVGVTDADGNEVAIVEAGTADARVQISTYDTPSAVYNVVIEEETPAETMFIVNVDNPSRVAMFNTTNYSQVQLQAGKNLIEPGVNYSISPTNGIPLVSVQLNGEEVKDQYGMYAISSEESTAGSVLDIVANYPDVEYTYTFVYPNDGPVWDKAYWEDDNFERHELPIVDNAVTVKAGRNVLLFAIDPDNWKDVTITLPNGETGYWLNFPAYPGDEPVANLSFTSTMPSGDLVTEATAINKIVYTEVTINVDGDAAMLNAAYGNTESDKAFTTIASLKEGANTVTIPEGNSIRFTVKEGGSINEVTFVSEAGKDRVTAEAAADGSFLAGPFGQAGSVNVTMGETEAPSVTFTLTVDNPEAIKLYTFYSYYSPDRNVELPCELVAGVNTIKVAKEEGRDWAQITVAPADKNSVVNSVRYRAPKDNDWWNAMNDHGAFSIFVYEGTQVEVDAATLELDKECTVWTDFGNNNIINLVSADGRKTQLIAGYMTFNFNEAENPFTVECTKSLTIYVNGELNPGNNVTLGEGDLIKIFAGSTEPLTVGFDFVANEAECEEIRVVDVMLDGRTSIANDELSLPLEVLYATEISFAISAPEDVTYAVKYGDDELKASEEGRYTIWPRESGNVTVTYTAQGEEEIVLYLVGDITGNEMKTEFMLNPDAMGWNASFPELSGKFRIISADETIVLGSNGQPLQLGVPYALAEGAEEGISLADGEITDVNLTLNPGDMTITVTGTPKAGIATIARDQLDVNALYFDLTGRRIETRNIATGIYIQVANGVASKIAVK